jgi:hypothetical protein
MKASDAISYLGQATRLKALTLPTELRRIWSSPDLADVEQAAVIGDVKLSFE